MPALTLGAQLPRRWREQGKTTLTCWTIIDDYGVGAKWMSLAKDASAVSHHLRMPDPNWWRQASFYQIYPRSFADGDGDGIGDFRGVLSRLDYLESLHIDAVWFSPFYPSALVDGGYDVDDYRNIDPIIGTLDQFDAVVCELHARDIKVMIDIVPNHSSNRHEWFRAALDSGRGSAERDRYIFRDGLGSDGKLPPSDWQSFFGGSAWQRVDDGQWYLHLFTTEQPDWNWSNPTVREDFLDTLRFWGDRGVDGFRVDVAMGLAKDMTEPLPPWSQIVAGGAMPGMPFTGESPFAEGMHPLMDRDEVQEIYAEWRTVFDSYEPPLFAVAEVWVPPHRRMRYSRPSSLGQAFNFDLLQAPWDAAGFTSIIRRNLDLAAAGESSSTWVFANHDVIRLATRFAQPPARGPIDILGGVVIDVDVQAQDRGLARALAAAMLAFALPGSAYTYQGEELGLPEVTGIPLELMEDPHHVIVGDAAFSRDGCRVPLPWTESGKYFGFSDSGAHLPQPKWFGKYSVERESKDPGSALTLYRNALELRHRLRSDESVEWLDFGPNVVAFRRANGWISITNLGQSPVKRPPGRSMLASRPTNSIEILPDTTEWILDPTGAT